MSDDVLKLAREVIVNDAREMWSISSITLARAVIAQAEEIERLRAALTEVLDALDVGCDRQYDTRVAPMSSNRIDELRKLVTP